MGDGWRVIRASAGYGRRLGPWLEGSGEVSRLAPNARPVLVTAPLLSIDQRVLLLG